ncbi:tRNA dihydrouridine(20/20a) synthase DusA [Maribrevibacterium harenarium]|uniref:tRNA-dihydrouridine(20/20a) synthase n=1 Tax=Maribrevibacterium harenarium TaxID=2589817 RepID=A0A501WJ48_9GAMM|nr:tRNA dihydrouridine(20/20a) synthase DusA [Maribrevibacterium harenarium]TPE48465.1 tRNA dihydrouridine(20/20a) synthase DusA [Maribrevibacterium harenarium]
MSVKSGSKPLKSRDTVNRRFSIAPMMEWTTSEFRVLARCLSKDTLLYTEMVTTGALLQGKDPERFLRYEECEHPIALQLGGADAKALAKCAKMAEQYGYDEVNLNAGCPSDRVQNNMIGAILMAHVDTVKDAMKAMQDATSLPVTIKHRIGLDDQQDYAVVRDFVGDVASTGVTTFIVHARNAILQGLSPKENREIPPLKYHYVHQLKQDFPDLEIILNGGIKTLEETQAQLTKLDGVMVGREAYNNPWLLAEVDSRLFGHQNPVSNRFEALENYLPYVESQLNKGARLSHITRHLLGMFVGLPGGKQFRRHLSENGHHAHATIDVLIDAIEGVKQQLSKTKG